MSRVFTLRIGVCGIGSIGFRHARLLAGRPEIGVYVCDTTPAHREAANALRNLAGSTDSFEKLLGTGLDGLIIATPDHLHVEQTCAAFEIGLPVLLEKPIAQNAHEGSRLAYCEGDIAARVLVGYTLRHSALFLKAKELLDSGIIGTPVSFQVMLGSYETLVRAKNRFKPDALNNLFIDYSHEWDYLSWFLGPVRRVVATSHQSGACERTQNPNVVDSVLELESGVTGTAHLDYVQSPGQRNFNIIGDRGTLLVDAVLGLVTLKGAGEKFERTYRIVEDQDCMMEHQLDHFIEVIEKKSKPRVTLADGLNALRTADAMILSVERGTWQSIEADRNR